MHPLALGGIGGSPLPTDPSPTWPVTISPFPLCRFVVFAKAGHILPELSLPLACGTLPPTDDPRFFGGEGEDGSFFTPVPVAGLLQALPPNSQMPRF